MEKSNDRTGTALYPIGQVSNAFVTEIPPQYNHFQNSQKRAREGATNDEEIAKEEKQRKKAKRKCNDATALTSEAGIDPASVPPAMGTLIQEKTKQKQSSKKRKPSVVPFGRTDVTDHALDLTGMNGSATAGDPSVTNLHREPSNHGAMPHNSNDDILRAFQTLDFSRLASVLRSLELPSSGVDLNTDDNPFAGLLDPDYPMDDEVAIADTRNPIGSMNPPISTQSVPAPPHKSGHSDGPSTVTEQLPKPSKSTQAANPNIPATGPSAVNPRHATLLSTKWLSATKLKELVQSEGLFYKKGKFSLSEQNTLKAAVENYRVSFGLSQEQMLEVIFSKSKEVHGNFWTEITASVPSRPIIAVYHYIHRAYNPLRLQGKWTKEEDAALISAVGDLGQSWQKVKERVGRPAHDCRDRWRNHLVDRSTRQRGSWSKEEEEELTRIVQELTTEQGKNSDNDIFWGIVSQRMGNKRGRQQCRIKWTDSLNRMVKNGGKKPKWSRQDAFILVHKVASMNTRDDSEIDWKLLNDEDWDLWSAHILQRQWRKLKQSIKGHEEMAFKEMVEVLKQKCLLPEPEKKGHHRAANRLPKPSKKQPKSAEVIDDEADKWESEEQ